MRTAAIKAFATNWRTRIHPIFLTMTGLDPANQQARVRALIESFTSPPLGGEVEPQSGSGEGAILQSHNDSPLFSPRPTRGEPAPAAPLCS